MIVYVKWMTMAIEAAAQLWASSSDFSTPIGDVLMSSATPTTRATITASIDFFPSSVQ